RALRIRPPTRAVGEAQNPTVRGKRKLHLPQYATRCRVHSEEVLTVSKPIGNPVDYYGSQRKPTAPDTVRRWRWHRKYPLYDEISCILRIDLRLVAIVQVEWVVS